MQASVMFIESKDGVQYPVLNSISAILKWCSETGKTVEEFAELDISDESQAYDTYVLVWATLFVGHQKAGRGRFRLTTVDVIDMMNNEPELAQQWFDAIEAQNAEIIRLAEAKEAKEAKKSSKKKRAVTSSKK
jgi:hypothetical protein